MANWVASQPARDPRDCGYGTALPIEIRTGFLVWWRSALPEAEVN